MDVIFVLHQSLDVQEWLEKIDGGKLPRHLCFEMARDLGGRVLTRHQLKATLLDRMLGLCTRIPAISWAQARDVRQHASPSTVVFVQDPLTSIAIAMLRPKWAASHLVMQMIDASAPSMRGWLYVLRALGRQPHAFTPASQFLPDLRKLQRRQMLRSTECLDLHCDEVFNSPPDAEHHRSPRLVATAGAEQRDYATLAAAVEGLDVEVVACAVSPDAGPKSARYPDAVPANMRFERLDLPGLRDLYRRAAVVVVPMRPNTIGAGGTVAGEARLCGTPLIVSRTTYLSDLASAGLAVGVEPGDASGLRAAIVDLLSDDEARADLARRSRADALEVLATDPMIARWTRYLDRLFGAYPAELPNHASEYAR